MKTYGDALCLDYIRVIRMADLGCSVESLQQGSLNCGIKENVKRLYKQVIMINLLFINLLNYFLINFDLLFNLFID